jgi:transposase
MIPKNHICFFVEEFVESLDFTGFDEINEGPGHPSYHPRIIMKIIIQGMLCKERSSRKLASACRENFVFMYLAEKVQPEFSTFCRFRRNNKEFVKDIFIETVELASENGLIDLNLICTDGSKIKANSGKKKCIKKEQLGKLASIIDKMIEDDIKQDEVDKIIYGDKEENISNLEVKNLKGIVKEYRKSKNKEKLKERCRKAIEEAEKDPEMKKVSISDPESRMMKHSGGNYEPSYNAQFTVDSKNQIIIANDACQDESDYGQLKPQLEQVKENIGLKETTKIDADCGYSSGENIRYMEDNKIDGFIPNRTQTRELNEMESVTKEKFRWDDYEYDEDKNEIIDKGVRLSFYKTFDYAKKGYKMHEYKNKELKIVKRVPEFFRERLRMKKKMENEEAKKIYALRKSIVEPVIGDIKENLGFRSLRMKGLNGAKIELNLVSIAHNLKKIWIARGKLIINNQNIIFDLIIKNNQMYCDTTCSEI